jgi:DNA polymerase I-like protein with 3'-5' exonuclease and polymerase domains
VLTTEPATLPAASPSSAGSVSKFRRLASRLIVPTTAPKCDGLRVAFDVEADGLARDATKIHTIVIADLDSDQVDQYGPDQIGAGLAHLSRAAYLAAHNATGFDVPVLRRLYGWQPQGRIVDTLVAGRVILPNLEDLDDKAAAMGDPKLGHKLRGRYSIEAWGMRLRIPKVGIDITDWSQWTPAMQERCVGDTLICKTLWQFLQPDGYSQHALDLETRAAEICEQITAAGVPFDVNAAEQRRQQWTARRTEIGAELQRQFPGVNLASRKQLGALLESKGWVPEARTEKTRQAKIDDETLESLPALFPEFAGLAEYTLLARRIAALSTGKEAWCAHVAADGRIHGGLIHIGTPHSRAKHLAPNIAQVPNPKRGKPFAVECRSLFRAADGWTFVCCDQAGLQDRGFAHYLSKYDDGAYARAFIDGLDPHWKTATDLGLIAPGTALDKANKIHAAIREGAKSFRYAFLYGAGSARAGHIVANIIRTVMQIEPSNELHRQFFGTAERPSENKLKQIGKAAISKFIRGTPGLQRLRAKLEDGARHYGWLPGLDGRRVPVRSLHTALNFLVTSSEAIIAKRWLVHVYDELNERFRYGWDGDVAITLWVHDEIACCCRPEIADEIGAIMVKHAKEPAEFYKFKVPLDASYKIGKSWAGDLPDSAAIFSEHLDSGPSEKTHQRPFLSVEPDRDHCAAVENPENSGAGDDLDSIVIEDWSHIDVGAIKAQPAHPGDGRGGDYPHGEQRSGKRVAVYLYRNHLGEPHTKVEKRSVPGKHAQYPQSFRVNGAWATKKPAGWLKVPYRLPEMLAALAKNPATDVYCPEGEKDCETLAALDLIATTSSEGATNPKSKKGSNWTPELGKWFAGVRRLFILEDNDAPGRNFAREKANALAGIVPDIRIVSFSDVPETEDVTYWLEHGHGKDDLLARCESAPAYSGGSLESLSMADVKMEAIDWLWPGRFALGKLGLLVGLPDEGKSTLLCYVAGRLTNPALAWPNDEGSPPRCGTVLLLTGEDSPADTLVPRLTAADADPHRVVIVQMVRDRDVKDGRERRRMFSLADDLGLLRQKIEQIGDVIAIEIDPITAYLGTGKTGVDSFRDTDVRAVLGPLIQLANDFRIAVIAIMHFNKKTDVTNALLRISNSLAFGGVARHVFAVTKDAANSRRLVARAKNNIASEDDNRTLAFHFATKQVGKDHRDGRVIEAPFIEFEPGYVDVTATEALSAVNENKAPGALDDAKDFLREILVAGGGRALKADIEEAAEAEKIADKTLRRAKKALKVQAEKDRSTAEGKWFWILADDDDGGGL